MFMVLVALTMLPMLVAIGVFFKALRDLDKSGFFEERTIPNLTYSEPLLIDSPKPKTTSR